MQNLNALLKQTTAILTIFVFVSLVSTDFVSAEGSHQLQEFIVLDSDTLHPLVRAFIKNEHANEFTIEVQQTQNFEGEIHNETEESSLSLPKESAIQKYVILDKDSERVIKWLPFDPYITYENLGENFKELNPEAVTPKVSSASVGAEFSLAKNRRVVMGLGTLKYITPELIDQAYAQGVSGIYQELKKIDGVQGYIKIKLGHRRR